MIDALTIQLVRANLPQSQMRAHRSLCRGHRRARHDRRVRCRPPSSRRSDGSCTSVPSRSSVRLAPAAEPTRPRSERDPTDRGCRRVEHSRHQRGCRWRVRDHPCSSGHEYARWSGSKAPRACSRSRVRSAGSVRTHGRRLPFDHDQYRTIGPRPPSTTHRTVISECIEMGP